MAMARNYEVEGLPYDLTYDAAITALNSCQTNAAILEAVRKSGNALNKRSIPEMQEFVQRIGYKVSDLDKTNIIHIAGSKGKGSTSAFCESILRKCSIRENGILRPLKTGLFTSPHLIECRERIRINGTPIAKDVFASHFFNIWDAFDKSEKPGYFRFIFLIACRVFMTEKVDVAIMEVGVGGEYDATNVFEKPVVTGITSLGFDHMALLGDTLPSIAWHKAGIMKTGVPAFASNQPPDALEVLRQRANERGSQFPITKKPQDASSSPIYIVPDEDVNALRGVRLGLAGDHQCINAALAMDLCREFVAQRQKQGIQIEGLESALMDGLREASWPGRAQVLHVPEYPKISWYLDGAHTPESLENKTPFDKVIFSTADIFDEPNMKKSDAINHTVANDKALSLQKANQETWCSLVDAPKALEVQPSIERAIMSIAKHNEEALVLVTGSLHLVGGTLSFLNVDVK
ncbi:Folylpolyglutamate synthetase [Chytridiales sp. JEL 0842]|nr:Folylpolyglutamate synthetase [Chytridiales sp. JEL 0842]